MRCLTVTLGLAATISSVTAQACKPVQYHFPKGSGADVSKQQAIKAEYEAVWADYVKYALPQDDLLPLNYSGENDLFGWGASPVDGIDTAVIMGLTSTVKQQLDLISKVDFSKSNYIVDEFDAMIRYIGGLLSAHDVINSSIVPKGTYNQTQVDYLLTAAMTISNKLKPMFNTPSGLPLANINFTTEQYSNCNPIQPCNSTAVDTAQCGTIILEWTRLSALTGDDTYRQLAQKAEEVLISPSQKLIHPNIVGSSLNYVTGKYTDFAGGWQAGIDSFYEYLIKTYIYQPNAPGAPGYKDFWVGAVDSTIKYLVKHPYGFPNLNFISQLNANGSLEWTMDDYACFAGGNFLLGGAYLGIQQFIDLGVNITDSCHQTFNTTPSGLNPTQFSWFNEKNKTYQRSVENDPAQVAYFQKAGYFVDDPFWDSYPEPIESMFYAYRITGNPIWREYAWEVFQAILRDTKRSPSVPFAELNNVTQPLGGTLSNYVPSFYFAETLKYLYLIFSDPSLISLDTNVFNTEGHPFKIQNGTCT